MNFKLILAATAVAGLGTVAAPAQAAFPGENGPILFGAYAMPGTGVFELGVGAPAVQLIETGDDTPNDPSVSPDGTRIVYADNVYKLWVADRDGSDPVMITPAESQDWTPAWAPDGTLVFANNDEGGWELYRANADGSDRERIGGGIPGHHPAVSPDGKTIAYAEGSEESNLYTIGANGNGEPTEFDEGYDPDWTPDGEAVVYGKHILDDGSLFRWDAESGNVTEVNADTGKYAYGEPSVSPDGTKIVARAIDMTQIRRGDGGPAVQLRTMDIDGTNVEDVPQSRTARTPFWAAGDGTPPPPRDEDRGGGQQQTQAPAPAAEQPAPAVQRASAPSATRRVCGSRRFFTINIRGKRLRKVAVRVNGKTVKATRSGSGFKAQVDLRTLPKGRFTVAIRKTTARGAVSETRRYRTCTPRR